jgi:FdhD protein
MWRIKAGSGGAEADWLAAEEPLEIRVEGHSVAVVMRTPGDDRELAAGFLVTEGVVRSLADVIDITRCSPGENSLDANVINVQLSRPQDLDLKRLSRHLFTSSSCGICSKATIEAVQQQFAPLEDDFEISPAALLALPGALAATQETFHRTGGLHACALFDLSGRLLVAREDVGRHNALDKVVGWALLENHLPLRRHILLLSGRASFEMMQKALAAGIPVVAAISAPTSLAVEFARQSGQTLAGFLRGQQMNVYAGANRLGFGCASAL